MKQQVTILRRTQHSGVLSDDMWMIHGRRDGANEVPDHHRYETKAN